MSKGGNSSKDLEERVLSRVKANDPSLQGVRIKLQFPDLAKKFFKLLRENTQVTSACIRELDLDEDIGKEVGTFLQENKSVTFLQFADCNLKPHGISSMSKGLKANKTLTTLILGPEKYAHLANEKPVEMMLSSIIEAGTIQRLELIELRLEQAIMGSICRLLVRHPLRSLSLAKNPISDDGYNLLAGALPRATALRSLILDATVPSAAAMLNLVRVIQKDATQLVRLSLAFIPSVDLPLLNALVECAQPPHNLAELELASCKINAEGGRVLFQAVSQNCTLRRLDLADNDIRELRGLQLQNAHNINDLNLPANHLNDDALTVLAQQLPWNRSLFRLNLFKNDFTADAVLHRLSADVLQPTSLIQLLVGTPQAVHTKSGAKAISPVSSGSLSVRESVGASQMEADDLKLDIAAQQVLARNEGLISLRAKLLAGPRADPRQITWDHTGAVPCVLDASALRLLDADMLALMHSLRRADMSRFDLVHTVRLFDNRLSALSTELLEALPRGLTRLEAARNGLRELATNAMTSLTRLAVLDVRCNALEELPEPVAGMPSLRQLLVSQNKLTALPRALLQRTDVELHVMGNALPHHLLADLRSGSFSTAPLSAEAERDFCDLLFKHDASHGYGTLRAVLQTLTQHQPNLESVLGAVNKLVDQYAAGPKLLPLLLARAAEQAPKPNAFMREDGPEPFLVTRYLTVAMSGFLDRTIKVIAERIVESGKLPIANEVTGPDVNQKETVPGLVNALFDLMQRNIELVPAVVRELVSRAATLISGKWTDLKKDRTQALAVASLLFLRVVTPALISPDTSGLLSAKHVKSKSKRKNLLAVAKQLQSLASSAFDEENQVRAFAVALCALPVDSRAIQAAPSAASTQTDHAAHELVSYCRSIQHQLADSLRDKHSPVAEMVHVLMDLDTALTAGADLSNSRLVKPAPASPALNSNGSALARGSGQLRASPAEHIAPSASSSDLSSSSH